MSSWTGTTSGVLTTKTTYGLLTSLINPAIWLGEDLSGPLCTVPATLKPFLDICKTSLVQEKHTWRSCLVLRCKVVWEGAADAAYHFLWMKRRDPHLDPKAGALEYIEESTSGIRDVADHPSGGSNFNHLEIISEVQEVTDTELAVEVDERIFKEIDVQFIPPWCYLHSQTLTNSSLTWSKFSHRNTFSFFFLAVGKNRFPFDARWAKCEKHLWV